MDSNQLLFVCLSALLAVFVLLTVLAVTMRILVAVFPETLEKLAKSDAALLAAVTTAAASIYPGMRVTRVEEEK
jgi:TRAP-type C4-dicarboxylate transport system permease small subunit